MKNDWLVRSTVFRNELQFLFHKFDVPPPVQGHVVAKLFHNADVSAGQLVLRQECMSRLTFRRELEEIPAVSDTVISELLLLFAPDNDLRLPPRLKGMLARNEPVAVLAGAGLSQQVGIPAWKTMSERAISWLFENNWLTYFDAERIKAEIPDPRQRLSIFHNLLRNAPAERHRFYSSILNRKPSANPNPYIPLATLNCIKVTTNFDNKLLLACQECQAKQELTVAQPALDGASSDTPSFRQVSVPSGGVRIEDLRRDVVYHLHGFAEYDDRGDVSALTDAIVTFEDYVSAYYQADQPVFKFLADLFAKYTIIFVGYSLSEIEVLERIISVSGGREHYCVQGVYSNSHSYQRLVENILRSPMNVTTIPYYMDCRGHGRLKEVLDHWVAELKSTRPESYYDVITEIDEVI